jgi:hypothetical protein
MNQGFIFTRKFIENNLLISCIHLFYRFTLVVMGYKIEAKMPRNPTGP